MLLGVAGVVGVGLENLERSALRLAHQLLWLMAVMPAVNDDGARVEFGCNWKLWQQQCVDVGQSLVAALGAAMLDNHCWACEFAMVEGASGTGPSCPALVVLASAGNPMGLGVVAKHHATRCGLADLVGAHAVKHSRK